MRIIHTTENITFKNVCLYVLKIDYVSMPKFYISILIFHNNMPVHSEIQTHMLNSNGF